MKARARPPSFSALPCTSACHDQFRIKILALELAAELPVEPDLLAEAGIFRDHGASAVGRPVAGLGADAPEIDGGGNLLPAHRQPMFVHVHRRQRVGLAVLFLADEAETTAAGAVGIEDVEPALDEGRLHIPA